jgi:hypothetical protein
MVMLNSLSRTSSSESRGKGSSSTPLQDVRERKVRQVRSGQSVMVVCMFLLLLLFVV